MRTIEILLLFLFLVLFVACRGKQPIVKQPKHGKATEFHRKPVKIIGHLFADYNYRGIDREEDRSFFHGVGGGLGFFFHVPMRWQWVGHKNLYYYADITVSPEYAGNPYPGQKKYLVSTYPGVYIRSYLPFLFKVFYGAGVNLRLSQTAYDPWGLYGQAGIELCGLTFSGIVIAHPGQANWEAEFRAGYMIYKPVMKCFGK